MAAVVALMNQKGGVGKTSTCHHLGGEFARAGLRVLAVDNDPQSSLSQGFFGPDEALAIDPGETIAAVYRGDEPYPRQIIRPSGFDRLDLIPGSESAASFNKPDPHEVEEEEQGRLKSFLDEAKIEYDIVLIDCPPNLQLCSWAALSAADSLVVPMQPEDYSAQGIAAVRRSVAKVQGGPNPGVALLGYLLTKVKKTNLHQVFEEKIRAAYGPLVFAATVPDAMGYAEAIAYRKPICHYRPRGPLSPAIRAVADELLARVESIAPKELAR